MFFFIPSHAKPQGMTLDRFATTVNTSKNWTDLVNKTFSHRPELKERFLKLVKSQSAKLPKALYENKTLTLKDGKESFTVKYLNFDGLTHFFELNGKPVNIRISDNLDTIIQKVKSQAETAGTSTDLFNIFVPQSQAIEPATTAVILGLIALGTAAVIEYPENNCKVASSEFLEALEESKVKLAHIDSCDDHSSKASYFVPEEGRAITLDFDAEREYQFTEVHNEDGKVVKLEYRLKADMTRRVVVEILKDGSSVKDDGEFAKLTSRFHKREHLNRILAGTYGDWSLGYDCHRGSCREVMNADIRKAQFYRDGNKNANDVKTKGVTE